MGRIEEQYELVKKQVEKADKLFEDNDMLPESLQNIFAIFENCANLLKDIKNMTPRTNHLEINAILKDMKRRNILKQDYSRYHSDLNNYRVRAFFGEYSREKDIVLPPKTSLKVYLKKARELFDETKIVVEDYIKPRKSGKH